MEVFVARQPILDKSNNVYAYELLYRDSEKNFFDQSITSNVATSILLMNSYYTFGIDKLAHGAKTFINFGKYLIKSEIPMLLDSETVVVELLEDIEPDSLFIEKIEKLKTNGYTIAMDDYIKGYKYPKLVQLCDIIKVDFFENTKDEIKDIVKIWSKHNKILLAEKVETQEMFEWAKSIGFELFQGYYFSKPTVIKGRGMQACSYKYVQVMQALNEKEPDFKKIASLIEKDVTLTYQLLKLVNLKFTDEGKVVSVQHGLSVLGIKAFEKWFSLAMIQNLGTSKPSEIVKMSMIRARMLELIAMKENKTCEISQMTLIGLLSMIDVLLERPMEEILEELPINKDVKDALLLKEGKYFDIYSLVLFFEKGKFLNAEQCKEKFKIDCREIANYYIDAVSWTENLYKDMYSI